MNMQGLLRYSIPLAAAVLVGAAPAAFAQGQELFEWSGRVDREVQISMRNNQLSTRNLGNNEYGRARSRVFTSMPRSDGQVAVQVLNGRGTVDVIQQPSARNGYETIVRISDRSGGADNYRIAAYWQGYANGDYVGRGRGRDRDRDRDRDGDRDDRGGNGGYGNGSRNGGYGNGGYGNGGYGNNGSLMHWSGNVDGEIEIRIQNGRVDYRTLSGAQPTSIRADRGNMTMPRNGASVYVAQQSGRGSVTVVQQPSSYNGYTTVVRVRDPQGGYGYYNFDLMWQ